MSKPKKITQAEMARALNISQGLVSRYAHRGMPVSDVVSASQWLRRNVGPRVRLEDRQPSEQDIILTANTLAKLCVDDFEAYGDALDALYDLIADEQWTWVYVPDAVIKMMDKRVQERAGDD